MKSIIKHRFSYLDIFLFILMAKIADHSIQGSIIFGVFAALLVVIVEKRAGLDRSDI